MININFRIKTTKRGYVVIREGGEYSQHAHFKKRSGALKIIELIKNNELPTKSYFVESARRLLTEKEFGSLKQSVIKQKYVNKQRRVR